MISNFITCIALYYNNDLFLLRQPSIKYPNINATTLYIADRILDTMVIDLVMIGLFFHVAAIFGLHRRNRPCFEKPSAEQEWSHHPQRQLSPLALVVDVALHLNYMRSIIFLFYWNSFIEFHQESGVQQLI